MALTGKAVSLLASVTECLDARQGNADRIGVMAVRRKCLADEMRFQTLYPDGATANPDAISRSANVIDGAFAQAFKTPLALLK